MKIIGLTGSIGMGKSATARLLRRLRVPVFDSDACVHALLQGEAKPLIARRFPECLDAKTRGINRPLLAQVIYQDKGAKRDLEKILHPLVWREQRHFLAKARRAGFRQVVLDIPLLYETGRHRICDHVICASAPEFLQHQRVLGRPHMTRDKLSRILETQIPDHHKRRWSDFTLPTGLGYAFALQRLKKALRWINNDQG